MSIVQTSRGFLSTLLAENGRAEHLFGAAGHLPGEPWLELKQVHSTRIVDAAAWAPGTEADGLATGVAGIRMAVKTADCVPLLLLDSKGRAAAAVHAGWRGTAQGIVFAAVRHLAERYSVRPREILAAMGPAAGGCCYEVGPEVAVQFRDWFPERNDLAKRTKIDLREALRRQLGAAGLEPALIDVAQVCTCCGGPRLHSYRRDGFRAGRLYSEIMLRRGG